MFVRLAHFPVLRPALGDAFDVEREVNSVFDELLGTAPVLGSRALPAVDVAEYANETVVVAELPGVKKDDVRVSFEKGMLSITGDRKPYAAQEGSTWIRNERFSGSFGRSVNIRHEVIPDAITAELANGVLRVVVPKAEKAKSRVIEVR